MRNTKVIAVCNHKGGVGKTVTTNCLGLTLAEQGKKVLMVDFDPQGNLTKGLGFRDKEKYTYTVKELMYDEINDTYRPMSEYLSVVKDNAYLLPANISFAGLDLQMAGMMSRETVLKRALDKFNGEVDYILIDSTPTMSLYTINTLVAADSLIIPVQAEPYATDGLEDLLRTIKLAKRDLNSSLSNTLSFDEIREAVQSHKSADDFFDYLGSIANQTLADVGTEWFEEAENAFSQTPDYTECTPETMEALIETAERSDMIATNIGKVPIEDYREIVAVQNGFDSYDEMYNEGIRIGNGYDKQVCSQPQKDKVISRKISLMAMFKQLV